MIKLQIMDTNEIWRNKDMSEKFNITYRGQLVEALETDSGEIIVGLPEQDGYRTTVVSCDQGWRFIRTDNSDIEYHF